MAAAWEGLRSVVISDGGWMGGLGAGEEEKGVG
jgi:hypothetical protein